MEFCFLRLFLEKSHNQPQNQNVCRIKGITKILEPLAVIALLAVIQPNWYQRKYGEILLSYLKHVSKQFPLIDHATYFFVYQNHQQQLARIIPPLCASTIHTP